jgi:hypothetical protein
MEASTAGKMGRIQARFTGVIYALFSALRKIFFGTDAFKDGRWWKNPPQQSVAVYRLPADSTSRSIPLSAWQFGVKFDSLLVAKSFQ